MFEPFLNQVSVSGGFPAHLQLRVTSESTSTVFGCGSTSRIGPTGDRDWKRERERESNNAVGLKGEKLLGEKDTTTVCFIPLTLDRSEWSGFNLLNIVRWLQCDSQWTSTKMLTLVFPTALKTRHETGSVKKEWSALVVNTLSLAPCSTTPPLAHLGFNTVR